MIDHITVTLNKLKLEHPNAATIIAGDKNKLDHHRLLAIDPNFHQIVSLPTLNHKILDIVITDLHRFYVEPVIINPIEVDVLGKGVPSNHSGVFVPPLDSNNTSRGTTKEVKHVRPLPESDITLFGESIKSIDWSSLLLEDQSSTALVDIFETITLDLVDIHFPLKEITITAFDKPWMTEELKALRRRRKRAYSKSHGRSPKYLAMRTEFTVKLKREALKYKEKIDAQVLEGKLGSAYAAVRMLGAGPNDASKKTFEITSFVDMGYSNQQSADLLDVNLLPPKIMD